MPDVRTSQRQYGFTLIETLIVVSVLSILATIAVPNLVSSRAVANEAAVIGTLRTLSTAEFRFKQMGLVDINGDTACEYGTFGEMCGRLAMRGTTDHLDPTVLSLKFALTDAEGRLRAHGYFISVYLPDATGVGLAEKTANFASFDPTMCADFFTVVAWPITLGTTGKATFFLNQQGELLKCEKGGYSGTSNAPRAGCALVGTDDAGKIDSQQLAISATGADGNFWVPVR